jgi:hypothetical protein
VFRVPSRPTYAGATAPPRLAYGSRRRLVGVMDGRNGWQTNGRGPAAFPPASSVYGPAFRAPWGEPEHADPSVTITTQLFPLAWWTAPGLRARPITRATSAPVDLVDRLVRIPIEPEYAPTDVPASEQELAAISRLDVLEVAAEARTEPRAHEPRRSGRAARRSAQHRRGFAARLALVAVGLILSLIAVETATRRRP